MAFYAGGWINQTQAAAPRTVSIVGCAETLLAPISRTARPAAMGGGEDRGWRKGRNVWSTLYGLRAYARPHLTAPGPILHALPALHMQIRRPSGCTAPLCAHPVRSQASGKHMRTGNGPERGGPHGARLYVWERGGGRSVEWRGGAAPWKTIEKAPRTSLPGSYPQPCTSAPGPPQVPIGWSCSARRRRALFSLFVACRPPLLAPVRPSPVFELGLCASPLCASQAAALQPLRLQPLRLQPLRLQPLRPAGQLVHQLRRREQGPNQSLFLSRGPDCL